MSRLLLIKLFVVSIMFSCSPEAIEVEKQFRLDALPAVVISPSGNMNIDEKESLGKLLFWDPILSGEKDLACVTCHHPSHGYAERLDLSIGVGGEGLSANRKEGTLVMRNSITIINSAFNGINSDGEYDPKTAQMFWDNRSKSLEEQAIQPLLSAEEMRGSRISENDILDTLVNRLQLIPEYDALFTNAFGENGITSENIAKAIAAFERTLVSNNSRFDQYVNGNESALSSLEKRGMINFIEAGCINCHSGPMFSDYNLHILSVPENSKLNNPDRGNGSFAFRTPSLRNLAFTAPYMHNGIFKTLEDVLAFYDDVDEESQNPNVSNFEKDPLLSELDLPDDIVNSIIAFIGSLNDEKFDREIVTRVPSRLSPGGNIE